MGAALEIISLLATAAGAGLSYEGAQQSKRAMENATQNEVDSMRRLQKQATPIYEQNLSKSTTGAQKTMDDAKAAALNKYQQLSSLPTEASGPQYTGSTAKEQDARTQSEIARSQQAAATLRQFPALENSWRVGNTNTNAQLGNLNSIGQSLASVFPAILSQASQAGASTQGIGSLLGSAGSLLGTYGALGNTGAGIARDGSANYRLPITRGIGPGVDYPNYNYSTLG